LEAGEFGSEWKGHKNRVPRTCYQTLSVTGRGCACHGVFLKMICQAHEKSKKRKILLILSSYSVKNKRFTVFSLLGWVSEGRQTNKRSQNRLGFATLTIVNGLYGQSA
jgi:hypothetical protein